MCGTKNKECAICAFGEGGCLASMREDHYVPATREQVEARISEGRYKNYDMVMRDYLSMQSAKSKQTPQKVNNEKCFSGMQIGNCPSCGEGCNSEMNYCDKCGQRLEWAALDRPTGAYSDKYSDMLW